MGPTILRATRIYRRRSVMSKEVEQIVPTLQAQSGNSKYHSTATLSLIVTNKHIQGHGRKEIDSYGPDKP